MSLKINIGLVLIVLIHLNKNCYAENGYHYDRPTNPPLRYTSSYSYATLPTIVPLPPLPSLPPLPTAPSGKTHIQTLHQVHPPSPTSKSIAAAYLSPKSYISQQQPQVIRTPFVQQFGSQTAQTYQPSAVPLTASAFVLQNSLPPRPPVNNERTQAVPQPARISFRQQSSGFSYSGAADDLYAANGRQLKQYHVIEDIDNDIEQSNKPFLSTPFFDAYRARIGASGTGATQPLQPSGGIQLQSRTATLLAEQQRLSLAPRPAPGEAIALGSGGLGFVRLANGNIYLGSGSLGYITGQEHLQSIQNVRTRSGAKVPDPLHFGHGPLGDSFNRNRVYRFK